MEFKTKAPLLLLSSLLLLGCGPSASSSTSPSSSEPGTSDGSSSSFSSSSLESSSDGSSNEESESSYSSEPSADLTLEEAASLLGQANFTMDALCDYEGGSIEYFDYVVSTDLVIQTYGDETYIYGSNGQYTCQAYLYDGALEDQSILSPVPGADVTYYFAYTAIDFFGAVSDWEEQGEGYVSTNEDSSFALFDYFGFEIDSSDSFEAISLTIDGDSLFFSSSFSSYYYGDAEFLIEVNGFGEAEYEGAQLILDGLSFAAPTSWGEVYDSYYSDAGIAFPDDLFGVGYYATEYGDEYSGYYLYISDCTADIASFASGMDAVLLDAGFTFESDYSSDGFYYYSSDSYYLYFTVYSAEETGAPEIFPSGQVEVILGSLG